MARVRKENLPVEVTEAQVQAEQETAKCPALDVRHAVAPRPEPKRVTSTGEMTRKDW